MDKHRHENKYTEIVLFHTAIIIAYIVISYIERIF